MGHSLGVHNGNRPSGLRAMSGIALMRKLTRYCPAMLASLMSVALRSEDGVIAEILWLSFVFFQSLSASGMRTRFGRCVRISGSCDSCRRKKDS